MGSNFSYFSSFLFEYFFSFVFCIFATCGMGTSRGRHQQSSFPVFLQMQPCISGKSNLLFFPTLSGHLIIRWVHLWSTFTCAPHAMSIQNPQKEKFICALWGWGRMEFWKQFDCYAKMQRKQDDHDTTLLKKILNFSSFRRAFWEETRWCRLGGIGHHENAAKGKQTF